MSSLNIAVAAMEMLRTIPTVLASPSAPSRRFKALIDPSSQMRVNGMANSPNSMGQPSNCRLSMRRPVSRNRLAEMICPTSFCRPRSPNRSSSKPTKQMVPAEAPAPTKNQTSPANTARCDFDNAVTHHQYRRNKGNEDGDAATKGYRVLMKFAVFVGTIHNAEAAGQSTNRRRHSEAHEECDRS